MSRTFDVRTLVTETPASWAMTALNNCCFSGVKSSGCHGMPTTCVRERRERACVYGGMEGEMNGSIQGEMGGWTNRRE